MTAAVIPTFQMRAGSCYKLSFADRLMGMNPSYNADLKEQQQTGHVQQVQGSPKADIVMKQ